MAGAAVMFVHEIGVATLIGAATEGLGEEVVFAAKACGEATSIPTTKTQTDTPNVNGMRSVCDR